MPDDPKALAKILRADPMGMQEHLAYQQAIGAPLVPQPQMPQAVPNQMGPAIPPNVQGLAKLLIQTGRATPETALQMAQQMTLGR